MTQQWVIVGVDNLENPGSRFVLAGIAPPVWSDQPSEALTFPRFFLAAEARWVHVGARHPGFSRVEICTLDEYGLDRSWADGPQIIFETKVGRSQDHVPTT